MEIVFIYNHGRALEQQFGQEACRSDSLDSFWQSANFLPHHVWHEHLAGIIYAKWKIMSIALTFHLLSLRIVQVWVLQQWWTLRLTSSGLKWSSHSGHHQPSSVQQTGYPYNLRTLSCHCTGSLREKVLKRMQHASVSETKFATA